MLFSCDACCIVNGMIVDVFALCCCLIADQAGNEYVTLVGRSFGTDGFAQILPITVTYGPNPETGGVYVASGCTVVDAHHKIRCQTVEGIGTKHQWRVNATGLFSLCLVFCARCYFPVFHLLHCFHRSAQRKVGCDIFLWTTSNMDCFSVVVYN
jgi:hypothetical protein